MKIPWHNLLANQLPLIGSSLRNLAIRKLAIETRKSEPSAARHLAQALIELYPPNEHGSLWQALLPPLPQASLNQIWSVWLDSRHPELTRLLLIHAKPASAPNHVRLYSLMHLGRMKPVDQLTTVDIDILAQACFDSDIQISQLAQKALLSLKKQSAIDHLCQIWTRSRSEKLREIVLTARYVAEDNPEARTYSALLQNNTEALLVSSPEMVNWLVNACMDDDLVLSNRAQNALRYLQDPLAIDRLCNLWAESRNPLVEDALLYAHYLPHESPYLRLLCALKMDELDIARNCPPTWLPDLLRVCQDKDDVIAKRATSAASSLNLTETQSAICDLFISTNDPLLAQMIRDGRYQPPEIEKRALILFLSEQWEQYEQLDFDYQVMRTVYQTAKTPLRERIMKLLQTAGRTNYLTILTGVGMQTPKMISDEESQILIRTLNANQEWHRLWELCFQLEPTFCLEIIRILAGHTWQPDLEMDQFDFLALKQRMDQALPGINPNTPKSQSAHWLPFAIPQTTLRFQGRANCLAFAPHQPHLAIGSGARRILIWDFQKAIPFQNITGFRHALGNVIYLSNGTLLCSERTNTSSDCFIYTCNPDQKPEVIATHHGSITSLIPLSDQIVYSSSRDGLIALWNIETASGLLQKQLTDWPRHTDVTPQNDRLCLLSDRFELMEAQSFTPLPSPRFRSNKTFPARSILSAAAFSSDGKNLATGSLAGDIVLYQNITTIKETKRLLLAKYAAPVRKLVFMQNQPRFTCANQDGQIHIFDSANFRHIESIKSPHESLISSQISPDEYFMATGSNKEIVIWDLRSSILSQIFSQPLNKTSYPQADVVNNFLHNPNLPHGLKNSLEFLKILLDHKFRYDIHLESAPILQPGEYDIQLE